MTEMTYVQALNAAIAQEMERDPAVLIMGEDIGEPGGIFTITKDLYHRFGPDRVMDTPIGEAGFVGMATGAAIAGLRPIVELMFVDFALVAADQLLNQAAKLRYLSGGDLTVPLTVRTQQGVSSGGGAQHSQSMESIFAAIPGMAIALPSCPADAKGLLTAAIRMDEPTLVLEHQRLYFTKGDVPDGEHVVPFGQAAVRRSGDDVTLIAYSRMVEVALAAAEELAAQGIQAEVIDLRTIVPLDLETVAASVSRTGAAVVVQEAPGAGGMASHIAALVTEACWSDLRSPVARVTGLDMPVPYARTLEERWLVSSADVVTAARGALEGGRVRAATGPA